MVPGDAVASSIPPHAIVSRGPVSANVISVISRPDVASIRFERTTLPVNVPGTAPVGTSAMILSVRGVFALKASDPL